MIYNYLFWTYYRFWEKVPTVWWSEWKAILTLSMLELFIVISLLNWITCVYKITLFLNYPFVPIIISLLIYGVNYYLFLYKKKWKEISLKNEKISKWKDTIGILFVILFTLFVLWCFIYSNYLLNALDWDEVNVFKLR